MDGRGTHVALFLSKELLGTDGDFNCVSSVEPLQSNGHIAGPL